MLFAKKKATIEILNKLVNYMVNVYNLTVCTAGSQFYIWFLFKRLMLPTILGTIQADDVGTRMCHRGCTRSSRKFEKMILSLGFCRFYLVSFNLPLRSNLCLKYYRHLSRTLTNLYTCRAKIHFVELV